MAEVAREHRWQLPKSLDLDKNLKPKDTLFCRELRFVAIYALFGDLLVKKVPFLVKNSVSWARSALLHGIYCIFYWIRFANLRLRTKTTHLSRKLQIRAWRKFAGPFLPPKAAKFCHPTPRSLFRPNFGIPGWNLLAFLAQMFPSHCWLIPDVSLKSPSQEKIAKFTKCDPSQPPMIWD